MSIAAARKELKGQLKSPLEVPSLQDFSLMLEIVRIAIGLDVLLLALTRSLLQW
jgi:hypothetical protein